MISIPKTKYRKRSAPVWLTGPLPVALGHIRISLLADPTCSSRHHSLLMEFATGTGAHLDEQALIRAIDDGKLSGACLDVFAVEPLPASSILWTHPRVTITPHVASYWVDSGIEQTAEVCRQVRSGIEITNLVDLGRGY